MESPVDLSVVIPFFNEEENVQALYDELKGVLDGMGKSYEVVMVDDGSSDGTFPILEKIALGDPHALVLRFRRNFGQTAALSAGIERAAGRVIVPMDGDLQNDPADIPKLLAKMAEGFDCVSGWRAERQDKAVTRKLPSMVANKLISRISGVHLHDYGCTMKAYRREVIDGVRLYGEMHRFIPIYAAWQGARVTEMAVNHRARKFGVSKYGLDRVLKVVLDLAVVKFLFHYLSKPIYVFGGFGLGALGLAFIAFTLAVIFKLTGQKDFVATPLPLFAGIAGLVGVQSILVGLIAEVVIRTYYESQNKRPYLVGTVVSGGKRISEQPMCGIAGVVSATEPVEAQAVVAMTRAIAHRGPDDDGVFVDGQCGLGFRRLSIIDLEGGHQPMTVEHATVVFNGEIYNFQELRHELEGKGHRFKTRSDTEVIARGYLTWGERVTDHLDGMFAFALWDARVRRLVAARDRFGKKPFYYLHRGPLFLFGSELKALLAHPGCPRELDPVALRRYLAFEYVPTPDCILQGVRKLGEGHRLVLENGSLTLERYWKLPASTPVGLAEVTPRRAREAVATLRDELDRAVRRRLVSDVPLGVFLSGGIDSTAVAALAMRAAGNVKTFSIGFEEGSFDESPFARRAAAALGTEHSEERLSPAAALDLVPQLADQLDEPFADPSYVPTFLLSKFTRSKVTVALGGDGADELFAGYDSFLAHPAGAVFSRMPGVLQRSARALGQLLPTGSGYMSLGFRAQHFLKGASWPEAFRHQAWIGSFTPDTVQAMLAPAMRSPPGEATHDVFGPLEDLARESGETGLDLVQRYYLGFYLKDDILVKVNRASMAASLEVRTPFLDTRLVEWALNLPFVFKMRGLTRKWLLRKAVEGLVPDEVLRRKKHGFALPVAAWLRGPLRPLLEDLLSERALSDAGVFDPRAVRALVNEHVEGRADHRKALWTLMVFQLWRRKWLVR